MPSYCLHCCLEDNLCTCDVATKRLPVNNPEFCLPAGTLLDGKYLIGRVLGSGGFGITYLAVDELLGLRVAIKEYMPRAEAVRSSDGRTVEPGTHQDREAFNFGLEKFLEEARVLARISSRDNPRIVSLFSFFTAHGTAYLVMAYLEGQTLAELLRSRGGSLPEQEAKYYLTAILDGLREVHSEGLIHRDIKPHNVFVTNDGGVKLIDFGAARYAQGAKSRALTQVLTAPYAPFEQYSQQAAQGPWTDLYAVGVTFYEMLTGRLPADAPSRVGDPSLVLPHAATSGQVSKELDALVTKAMHPDASKRFQTVDEFFKALSLPSSITIEPQEPFKRVSNVPAQGHVEVDPPHISTSTPPPAQRSLHPAIYVIGTAIVVLLAVLAFYLIKGATEGPPVVAEEAGTHGAPEPVNPEPPSPVVDRFGLVWVRIEGGSFYMGSNDGEPDENPVHLVTVPTFQMTRTPVTVDQFKACVDAGACTAPGTHASCNWGQPDRGSHPVNCVRWSQAQAFANWAGGRLPTEAEWEYAARSGGRDWKYPWGNEKATCDRAVMRDSSGGGCGSNGTLPVCSKPMGNTSQGLCDMAGNVWEWLQDWYHDSYDGAPRDGSAWELPPSTSRSERGGSWLGGYKNLLAANRNDEDPNRRYATNGFRLAKSVR
ncbi:MAG TPA: bifunctional serine/threonine-protein kinase/formylglycine-generating enzyme family protein [Myxococcota bacterium]|nr:bifunctional serine/threonine-protein kinase/formylglycine-generating enzyme family protein [Myxococcota bacterium]